MTASRVSYVGRRVAGLSLCAAVIALIPAAQAQSPRVTLKGEHVESLGATVLADKHGRTLYRLKPETGKHLLCTSHACLATWPLATVASNSTRVKLPPGIRGKVRLLRRGKRFQVTFRGLPLYRFAGDSRARRANGQHIHSFGGVWSVLTVSKDAPAPPPPAPGPSPY